MSNFTNILALDTALAGASAAVVGGDSYALRSEMMVRGQAEYLVPFADEAMAEIGLEYDALDAVLCTVGPGAFTGLRIGMSAARAFGLSLDIPVIGISTLDALAGDFCAHEKKPCSVILETKRKDFYFQHFNNQGQAVSKRIASEKIEIPEGSVLIGDGVERFLKTVEDVQRFEVNEDYGFINMVEVAKRLQSEKSDAFMDDPEPIYLRGADVSQPKTPPRVIESD
ncbi:MAG: tRNA (adenosine(37)-N6)-threonylcarbamoyltransferase complex dimerization subunit type 1 TsaB [Pseudomonadota bacterium]